MARPIYAAYRCSDYKRLNWNIDKLLARKLVWLRETTFRLGWSPGSRNTLVETAQRVVLCCHGGLGQIMGARTCPEWRPLIAQVRSTVSRRARL